MNTRTYSFIVLGPSSSGKTSLIQSFINQTPTFESLASTSDNYHVVSFEETDTIYRLEILDTAGINLHSNISRLFFSSTSCVFMVVDLEQQRYKKQMEYMINEIRKTYDSKSISCTLSSTDEENKYGFPIVVIGTKSDQVSSSVVGKFQTKVRLNGFEPFICNCNDIELINETFFNVINSHSIRPQRIDTTIVKVEQKKVKHSNCVLF
ncbi:Ras family GTPase [Entamoeba marina]